MENKEAKYLMYDDYTYIAKAVDMVEVVSDWAKDDIQSYFEYDLSDTVYIDQAITRLEEAKKIVQWIAEHNCDDIIVCNFEKDWFSDIEITTELPKKKEEN